jgi:hypothetical protein
MRALAVAGLALALAGCAGDEKQAAPTPLQREISGLVDDLVAFHPDVDHQVPLRELRAEANELAARAPELSRDELVVGLLRLTTLGERDGHGGIFLHDPAHTRPFHFFPLRVHDFVDGVHVVAEPDGSTTRRTRSSSASPAAARRTSGATGSRSSFRVPG